MAKTLLERVKDKIAEIQKLRKIYDQKQGERTQIMKQLKQEFEVGGPQAGEDLLEEYATQAKTHKTDLQTVEDKLDDILAATKTEES